MSAANREPGALGGIGALDGPCLANACAHVRKGAMVPEPVTSNQ